MKELSLGIVAISAIWIAVALYNIERAVTPYYEYFNKRNEVYQEYLDILKLYKPAEEECHLT